MTRLSLPRLRPDRDRGPAHAQISERMAELIASGELAPGDRLPPERTLAKDLGVSRMTLRHALASLERRGLLDRSSGRTGGTFVAEPRVERDLGSFRGLSHELSRHGLVAGARVVSATEREADETVAGALSLRVGAPVYEIVRVRLANGDPIALERSTFPAERFPGLLDLPLDGSLYALLGERYGAAPRRAVEWLEPVLADREAAAALEVKAGAPLMAVERRAYAEGDEVVEWALDLFRGDRARMVAWRSEVGRAE